MVCLLKSAHSSCSASSMNNHWPFLSFHLSLFALGSRFTTKSLFCKCPQLPFPRLSHLCVSSPWVSPLAPEQQRTTEGNPPRGQIVVTLKLSSAGCSQVRNLSNQLPLPLSSSNVSELQASFSEPAAQSPLSW